MRLSSSLATSTVLIAGLKVSCPWSETRRLGGGTHSLIHVDPRWASYSLGVFLCIRCAGIHRKMGTHISKVKSITMDQWTSEQIEVSSAKWSYAHGQCELTRENLLDDAHIRRKYRSEQ